MPSAPEPPTPARAGDDVDHRDVRRVVHAAALSCYGVVAVSPRAWTARLATLFRREWAGVAVETAPHLRVEVNVSLSPTVPRAQVVANVADAIRYAVQRDFGRTVDELAILVDGIAVPAGGT